MEPGEYEDANLEYFFGLDRKGYEAKMQTKQVMRLFFENCNSDLIDSSQINDFLMEQRITEKILTDCPDYSKVITGEWLSM